MTFWRLVTREILYRKLSFGLGVTSAELKFRTPDDHGEVAVVLPKVELGYRFTLGGSTEVGVGLLALPDRFGTLGVMYKFPADREEI